MISAESFLQHIWNGTCSEKAKSVSLAIPTSAMALPSIEAKEVLIEQHSTVFVVGRLTD